MELRSLGSDAQDGFAEAEDAVGSVFERWSGGVVGGASDDNLDRMMCEHGCGEAVGRGEEAVLRGDAGEGFERFLGEGAVPIVAGESVHANQSDGSDGIRAGRGGILKGLAADVEAAHWSCV